MNSGALPSRRVLVVEDEPHVRDGLSLHLQSEGFEVDVVARGDHAIAAVEQIHPDLIILDVMLPGLNGIDVCRHIRTRGCNVPIIFLTARSQELDRVLGL